MRDGMVDIHIISDSLGDTAAAVVDAALSQFPDERPTVIRLTKVTAFEQIERHFTRHRHDLRPVVVFHTIVDPALRRAFKRYANTSNIYAIDILGPAVNALSVVLDRIPADKPGLIHATDERYFRRIDAMEYTVNHDDGRASDDLSGADIVIIGVSRTSKTPLSLVLASRGYKVANVPLASGVEPPASLGRVPRGHLFGLMSTVEVIASIRKRRLGTASAVAAGYADPYRIQVELDEARALMRRLGCYIIHTENRAIEETAQEILRYYNGEFAV